MVCVDVYQATIAEKRRVVTGAGGQEGTGGGSTNRFLGSTWWFPPSS